MKQPSEEGIEVATPTQSAINKATYSMENDKDVHYQQIWSLHLDEKILEGKEGHSLKINQKKFILAVMTLGDGKAKIIAENFIAVIQKYNSWGYKNIQQLSTQVIVPNVVIQFVKLRRKSGVVV